MASQGAVGRTWDVAEVDRQNAPTSVNEPRAGKFKENHTSSPFTLDEATGHELPNFPSRDDVGTNVATMEQGGSGNAEQGMNLSNSVGLTLPPARQDTYALGTTPPTAPGAYSVAGLRENTPEETAVVEEGRDGLIVDRSRSTSDSDLMTLAGLPLPARVVLSADSLRRHMLVNAPVIDGIARGEAQGLSKSFWRKNRRVLVAVAVVLIAGVAVAIGFGLVGADVSSSTSAATGTPTFSSIPTISPTNLPTSPPTLSPTNFPTSAPSPIPWVQVGTDIDGIGEGDYFGASVSLSDHGTRLAIGSPFSIGGGVRVFEDQGGKWEQVGKDLKGDSAVSHFGYSVSMSGDGKRIAVGHPYMARARVQVFQFLDGTWVLFGSSIVGENYFFGTSVSLSADGSIVAVGSHGWYVSVFRYSSGVWVQLDKDLGMEVDLEGPPHEDMFHLGVSLSPDGFTVAVGVPYFDFRGRVRIYAYESGVWEQIGQDIDGETSHDMFGMAVSLSYNGRIVAVGARWEDGANYFSNDKIQVYWYDEVSGEWLQRGADIYGEEGGNKSGRTGYSISVSLSSDGNVVAFGAAENDENGEDSGLVRIFRFDNDEWVQVGGNIDGEDSGDESGYSVSLSGDGNRVAVGAPKNDGNRRDEGVLLTGHVRVFDWHGPTPTSTPSFSHSPTTSPTSVPSHTPTFSRFPTSSPLPTSPPTASLTAPPTSAPTITPSSPPTESFPPTMITWHQVGSDIDGEDEDGWFGYSVSLSNNGTRLAIGAPNHGWRGQLQVLEYQGGVWVQIGKDLKGNSAESNFGSSVSMSGNGKRIAVGNSHDDGRRGQVKVFEFASGGWRVIGSPLVGEAYGDEFGTSVSLSADGSVVAAVATLNNGTKSGHVRVFQSAFDRWTQLGDLDDKMLSGLRSSVSLSANGLTIAIGGFGHARVCRYENDTWEIGDALFGAEETSYVSSVSLSANGNVVAVATPNKVRVYQYVQEPGLGEFWFPRGFDIDGSFKFGKFGRSFHRCVSLSSDGTIIAVGAEYSTSERGDSTGDVRIFRFDNNEWLWVQVGEDIDGEAGGDRSGYSVSLSGDGTRVAIGAYLNDAYGDSGDDIGHVRVFDWPKV